MITKRRGIESGIDWLGKLAKLKANRPPELGQHCPKHCPTQPESNSGDPRPSGAAARLGAPLNIRQVAELIGCSPWSVRNTWIPRGLPFFRSGASSRLLFYTEQIVRWIENQQRGGQMR